MKVYSTAEDACTLETPLMWGSKAAIELQVYVRVGLLRLVIPVSVRAARCVLGGGVVIGAVALNPHANHSQPPRQPLTTHPNTHTPYPP